MLDKEKVFSFFSLFADLEGAAAQKCRPLCDAAAATVGARLRPDLPAPLPQEDMECLCLAAAAIAWRDWQAIGPGIGQEVRVGEITLKQSPDRAASCEDICRHFEARAAHLLRAPALFRQVGP